MSGEPPWKSVLSDGSLGGLAFEGAWEASGGSLRVDSLGGGSWLSITDQAIEDFDFKTGITVVERGNASIFFRQQGEGVPRYYQFDLKPAIQAAVVAKANGDAGRPYVMSSVGLALSPGTSYDVEIAVRGGTIKTRVNGSLVNEASDGEYTRGHVCLTAWKTKAIFHDPCLRVCGGRAGTP